MKAFTQINFVSEAPNQHQMTLTPALQIAVVSAIVSVIVLKIVKGGYG